MTGIYYGYKNI